ncbi:HD domain-containing protein [candidate division KSB1 bacterium]|nr:HD domain-containing protein [candidate division KSB1 bacterium]RQW02663.1 MAG: HD domain-containing protein [candidate division KSB1 bacterium]
MNKRLEQQILFILEIDKLKNIVRRTFLLDESRLENTAEHSWHAAVAVLLLSEYAPHTLDILRIVKMMLIHDIVEIDAGDTFLYDDSGNQDKADRERAAADRLFTLLPEDQAAELCLLWDEFEERSTPEAKFARGLDRLLPLMHNYYTKGSTWRKHNVTSDMVRKQNAIIADASPELWEFARTLIQDSVDKKYLLE